MINRKINIAPHRDLSDVEWNKVKSFLPYMDDKFSKRRRGRPCGDMRTSMNGILYVMRTGTAWRNLPKSYGNWNTAYKCFQRWKEADAFEKIMKVLDIEEAIDNVYAYN